MAANAQPGLRRFYPHPLTDSRFAAQFPDGGVQQRFLLDVSATLQDSSTAAAHFDELMLALTATTTLAGRRQAHALLDRHGLAWRFSSGLIVPSSQKAVSQLVVYTDQLLAGLDGLLTKLQTYFTQSCVLEPQVGSAAELTAAFRKGVDVGCIDETVASQLGDRIDELIQGKLGKKQIGPLTAALQALGYSCIANGNKIEIAVAAPRTDDLSSAVAVTTPIDLDEACACLGSMDPAEWLAWVQEPLPRSRTVERYDKAAGTNLYFPIVGNTPIVDNRLSTSWPTAKACVVWFHGSGTPKAHGGNFWQEMNALSLHGIASLAFDYPFHGAGPRQCAFFHAEHFVDWVAHIVRQYRLEHPNQKIILAGHSFGPGIILELMTRYPDIADGAVLLSPAMHFTRESLDHYHATILKLLANREIGTNALGDLWEGAVEEGYLFMRNDHPTTQAPIRALIGADDPWLADPRHDLEPLRRRFPQLDLRVVPGLGHALFNATVQELSPETRTAAFGAAGAPVPVELARFVAGAVWQFIKEQVSPAVAEAPDRAARRLSALQQIQQLRENNPVFSRLFGPIETTTEMQATLIIEAWTALRRRTQVELLLAIPSRYANFYAHHREVVDQLIATIQRREALTGPMQNAFEQLMRSLREAHETDRVEATRLAAAGRVQPERTADLRRAANHWSDAAHEHVRDVAITYFAGRREMLGRHVAPGAPVARLWWALRRRLNGAAVVPAPRYSANGTLRHQQSAYLNAVQATLALSARTVLSVGAGDVVTRPLELFRDTDRVIVTSRRPFGNPADAMAMITADLLAKADAAEGQGDGTWIPGSWRRDYATNSGAEFLSRVITAYETNQIDGLYFFTLDPDGQKQYAQSSDAVSCAAAHAEIHFTDRHGRQRIVEVLHADPLMLSPAQLLYLHSAGVDVVYGGQGMEGFETAPQGLPAYHALLRTRNIPLVMEDYPHIPSRHSEALPPAFFDPEKVQTINLRVVDQTHDRLTTYHYLHVAQAGAIRNAWAYRDTRAWERHLYVNLRAASRPHAAGSAMPIEPEDHPVVVPDGPMPIAVT